MREKISKYVNLFPIEEQTGEGRLFRKMSRGSITRQVIGENTIAKFGEDIATWLGYSLEEAKRYTSHCFRRTGATLLAEKGASHPALKLAGGWRSDHACEGYINNSMRMKRGIANLLEDQPGNDSGSPIVSPKGLQDLGKGIFAIGVDENLIIISLFPIFIFAIIS